MPKMKYVRYALVAVATVGVFALTAFTNAGDASSTPTAEPTADAAAPHVATPNAEPYRYQPRYPREDLPTNPPGTWEVYASPTTKNLYYVDFVNINNGWAVGAGVMLRYRNGFWQEEPGHENYAYSGIDMVSTTDGWVIGRDGTNDQWKIWHWDGASWGEYQTVTGAIECIHMIDRTHGWIGGASYFLQFNGTSWVWGGSAPSTMMGIDMISPDLGWAVGYLYIMRRNSSGWVIDSNNNWVLGGVTMINANKGYASGYDRGTDKGAIIKYDGNWSTGKIFTNTETIGGLDIYGPDFGWCVGRKTTTPPYGGFIGFFDGVVWNEVGSPTNNALAGVKIIDRENGWAVGYYGTILKYKPNVSINETSIGKIKAIYR